MKDIIIATVVSCSPVGKHKDNLDRMKHWISAAHREKADVICFPELNLTGYSTQNDIADHALTLDHKTVRHIIKLSVEKNMVILFGLIEKGRNGKYYASHLVSGPKGLIGVYRKLHIAPPEKNIFSCGQEICLFEIPDCKFGIQLCYDAHFPEISSQMALKGAELIFIPHASPKGLPPEKYDSWMRHLPARAYDNSIYIVACNQIGDNEKGLVFPGLSLVIGPDGKIMKKHYFDKEGMMTVTLKAQELDRVRHNRMHFFLPNRRPDLY